MKVAFPQRAENQDSLNYKPTRLDEHDHLGLANTPSRRGVKPERKDLDAQQVQAKKTRAGTQGLLSAGIKVFTSTFRHKSPQATHLALGFLFAVLSKDDAST